MASQADRLHLLSSEPPASSAVILAAALDHAGPDEAAAIARSLLTLNRRQGVLSVLRNLHRIGPEAEDLVRSSRASFLAPARQLLETGDAKMAVNMIALVEYRSDWRLLPLAAGLLGADAVGVPRRAAEVLLNTVVTHLGESGRKVPSAQIKRTIDAALSNAADCYRDHCLEDVLLAVAIASARPGPKLAAILSEPDHPVVPALRGIVEHTGRPLVRRNLLRWLTLPQLGRQVLRWLRKLQTAADFNDLLTTGHLLLAPQRRLALRQADRPGRCLPAIEVAAALPGPSQAVLPQYVPALGVTSALRVKRLAELAALPSPLARLKTVLALAGHETESARQALDHLAHDGVPAVVSAAASVVLSRPDYFPPETVARLEDSSNRLIADRATRQKASAGVDAFFERWMILSAVNRLAIAHRLVVGRRADFIRALEVRLTEGSRSEALTALALIGRLGLVPDLEGEIIVQTGSPDAHIASAAAAALARGRSDRRLQALRAALRHASGRVRANALESLAVAGSNELPRMLESMAADRDNRLRANVLRAMLPLRSDRAVLGLREMLGDHDPLHRVSGIWVARRVHHPAVITELKILASADDQPELRSRARAALRVLDCRAMRGRANAPAGV